MNRLRTSGVEGVGFITAFPHMAKIFRFSPGAETVLDVRAFNPSDLEPKNLSRYGGFHEFACLAEGIISAGEYKAWAAAKDVEEYLSYRSDDRIFDILSSNKLKRYWG